MNFLLGALAWIFDPANYMPGARTPLPIQDRIAEHVYYTAIAVAVAAIIALPLGFYIGHTGRGRQFVIGFTAAMRAIPTLGLLFFLAFLIGMTQPLPVVGFAASILALIVLAIPSILAGAYSGLESVERETIDSARANGMSESQILFRVEIPLALPLILGGVRAAVLQVIATATIASFIGLGGLGRVITSGIALNDYDRILGGAILVTVLALVVDGLFALAQRSVRTPGVGGDARETKNVRRRSTRQAAVMGTPIEEGK